MIIKKEITLSPEEAAGEETWRATAIKHSGVPANEIQSVILRRRSIDARSRRIVVKLLVEIYTGPDSPLSNPVPYQLKNVSSSQPVIIVGCGPAGLFAALKLIEMGVKPIIIERGKAVKERRRDLAILNRDRLVNPDSNYCFGEGGAGTYSDGKLYTRSGKRGDIVKILDTFISHGASHEIGIDSHPHIGTNKLPGIIESMRETIIQAGGEVLFSHKFTGLVLRGQTVSGIKCRPVNDPQSSEITLDAGAVILATGHSARDIFEYLKNNHILIEAKSFALGVRIEHPQEVIDSLQYHCKVRDPFLPPAAYALTTQALNRGVYSFCMCPGGIIAVASTQPGEVVVNGWSPSKRNNPFANSGMVVSVGDHDFKPFEKSGVLRGMYFQTDIEQKAFAAGGNNLTAPAQRLTDFMDHKNSTSLPSCSYIPGIAPVKMDEVLPAGIIDALRTGINEFGKKMRGYITSEAVMVATESRTSSPVRIPRDTVSLMHPQINGLFPCGEGAGYAGGIMSAAMDGDRVAGACAVFLGQAKK